MFSFFLYFGDFVVVVVAVNLFVLLCASHGLKKKFKPFVIITVLYKPAEKIQA